MTNVDFKQILDEALKPIKEEQSEFGKEQAEFRKKLDEVSSGQESLEQGQESIKREIAELKNTIETLEEDANVDVPPEFKLEPLPETPFPQ